MGREGELAHDKGYYHSYKRTAPGPNTPDHPQALVPLPKTPAAVTALPAIVRCGGPPILCQGRFFRDATHGGPGPLLQDPSARVARLHPLLTGIVSFYAIFRSNNSASYLLGAD